MTALEKSEIRPSVRELQEPDYDESKFPQELIREGLPPQEKWMLRTIWRLDEKVNWLCRSVMDENAALRTIDIRDQENIANVCERLKLIEEWKIALMGKWGVISVAVITCVTAVMASTISLMVEKVFK